MEASDHVRIQTPLTPPSTPSSLSLEQEIAAAALAQQTLKERPSPFIQCREQAPDPKTMPGRQYLLQTVAPVLVYGLQKLARERPPDPISFLAAFLLQNRSCYGEGMLKNLDVQKNA